MTDAVARVLWLNGPHSIGKQTLAKRLRDQWNVPTFGAEAVGFTLQSGLPVRQDPGDLQDFGFWLWCMWRVAVEMARSFQMVAMPAALHRPDAVAELLRRFGQAGVDVLHVVLEAEDADLRERIHSQDVGVDAKRWALEHRHTAVAALSGIRDGIRLETTGRTPAQLAGDLSQALVRHGWLTDELEWTSGGRL